MKKIAMLISSSMITLFFFSCGSGNHTATQDSTMMDTAVAVEEIVVFPVLSEDAIGHASLKHTGVVAKTASKTTAAASKATTDSMPPLPVNPSVSAIQKTYTDSGYTVTATQVSDTAIISATQLNDTLTIYSVKKKDVEAFQIISDPNDPDAVQQVIISDKKGVDMYNVQNGMTVKEVKKIRGQMKHVVKHGKVILYTDDSNIEYTATLKDGQGDSVSESDIDDLQIDGIVWESKHKKKFL